MSLYYENGEPTKIGKAYSDNKQVWLVYEGPKLVWSFKEDYASMKLSNIKLNNTSYFANGHSIRFYDMRNHGLTPEIKSYKDVTNHKKHCKNVYANTYNLLADGSYKETGIYSCTGNFAFDYEDVDENLIPDCRGSILNYETQLNIDTNYINYTYYVKNDNSPDGVDRVDTIRDYSFFNGLFRNCINMHYSFNGQTRLTGKAVCGALTKNFSHCFSYCRNISEAVCGPNVINMAYSYEWCGNLTGSAACGNSVVNMVNAYAHCMNINKAVCSDSVVNMCYAYYRCKNLKGCAECGASVEDMSKAYSGCSNLQYGVCGDNVKNFYSAYTLCYNLLECNVGSNVINMGYSFSHCENLKTAGCSDVAEDMRDCFYECYNLTTFYMSNSAVDVSHCYDTCINLQGDVYIPEKTLYAEGAFYRCSNISGATIKSSKINTINNTFRGCTNLKQVTILGSVEFPKEMYQTFYDCSNLTSLSYSDSSFSNVTSMEGCFRGCSNLRMQCIIPPNIVKLNYAYYGCQNVYGYVTLPDTFTSISSAFRDTGITSITFPNVGSKSQLNIRSFIDRSKDIINRYGTVTIYCPAGAGILESIKDEYNFYKNDNGTIIYTGHNNVFDIDLRLI